MDRVEELKKKCDFLQYEIECIKKKLIGKTTTGPKVIYPGSDAKPAYTIINEGDNITNITSGGAGNLPITLVTLAMTDTVTFDGYDWEAYSIPNTALNQVYMIADEFFTGLINPALIYLPASGVADGNFVWIMNNAITGPYTAVADLSTNPASTRWGIGGTNINPHEGADASCLFVYFEAYSRWINLHFPNADLTTPP